MDDPLRLPDQCCATCKHWNKYETWNGAPNVGCCDKIIYDDNSHNDYPTASRPAMIYSPALLLTLGSFGCNQWEAK